MRVRGLTGAWLKSPPKNCPGGRVGIDCDEVRKGLEKALGGQAPAAAWAQKNQPIRPQAPAKLELGPPVGEEPVNSIFEVAPEALVPKQGLGMPE